MPDDRTDDITITESDATVVIEIPAGRWEGDAAAAERLLTHLHYVLGRARPGTNIASMFLNGQLWGGKFIETDDRAAIREMRILVDELGRHVASLEDDAESRGGQRAQS